MKIFTGVKQTIKRAKERLETEAEAKRQQELTRLRAEESREREERKTVERELKGRQEAKASKLLKKKELKEARAKVESERFRKEKAKKELYREKHKGLIKVGKIAAKIFQLSEPAQEKHRRRNIRITKSSPMAISGRRTRKKTTKLSQKKTRKTGGIDLGAGIVRSGRRQHIKLR